MRLRLDTLKFRNGASGYCLGGVRLSKASQLGVFHRLLSFRTMDYYRVANGMAWGMILVGVATVAVLSSGFCAPYDRCLNPLFTLRKLALYPLLSLAGFRGVPVTASLRCPCELQTQNQKVQC